MSPIPAIVRTAIDLKTAIDRAPNYLTPIGTCRSKASEWLEDYDTGSEIEDEEERDNEEVEREAMEQLHELQRQYMIVTMSGAMEEPFSLTISRPGCEYDSELEALGVPYPDVDKRLKGWYKASAVSGYGDVKAQETKIDASVRDAREIPASEFRVAPELITQIQDLWAEFFFPTKVRAEAYKIHLYGPGGKFKAHRDTPETDLVGTFLLGLGDTTRRTDSTSGGGAFQIKHRTYYSEWTRHTATLGNWVAFYPDVDHEVVEIAEGYRAVIAFKIFRQHLRPTPEVPADVVLRGKVKDVLAKLHMPYGILLRHNYSAGTAELNGVDAVMHAAAGKTGGDVKLLPVLIKWTAMYDEYRDGEPQCNADVFPLTEAHVDSILAYIKGKTDEELGNYYAKPQVKLIVDLKGTDAEWIDERNKSIRFYSPKFHATAYVWREDIEEASDHTGNESRPHAEDSIYLSYAVVVLPKADEKGGD